MLTSNIRLAHAPGNVLLPAGRTGLPQDSVANVSQVVTLDKGQLLTRIGVLPAGLLKEVDNGLRRVLDL